MVMAIPGTGPADETAALALYRARCGYYDLQLAPYEALRRCAIEHLALQPGQTVLDIGCGTGMSLDLLQQAVGPQGQVVAIDQSREMLEQARRRVDCAGWHQIELVCSPVQDAALPARADAALFHFTHDILQTPAALDHVLAHLAPGARLAVCGLKWAPPWFAALNPLVWWNAVQSVTTLDGLDAPWAGLAQRGARLTVESLFGGTLFLACGRMP
jgi:SAM-dependent methyltransferase